MKIKLATALALIIAVLSGWLFIDRTKADTSYVAMIEQRVDIKIVKDKIWDVKERLYNIYDEYGEDTGNEFIQERIRELKETLEELEADRERLYKK